VGANRLLAEPTKGFISARRKWLQTGRHALFSQGEAIEARNWYPSPDAPNHKFTSEITCHVPEGMTVISNGRQVSESKDANTGLVAFTWKQEKPHANYLISLVAGYFKKVEDKHRDVPSRSTHRRRTSTRRRIHSATPRTLWLSSRKTLACIIRGRNMIRWW
jgi:aminopeptidase N